MRYFLGKTHFFTCRNELKAFNEAKSQDLQEPTLNKYGSKTSNEIADCHRNRGKN